MNALDCHEILAERYEADPEALNQWLPEGIDLHHPETTPAILTAAVCLAGYLDDATSLEDLRAGCEHFSDLFGAEIITAEAWHDESVLILNAVMNWGDSVTSHERN